ncbi:membrane-bound O-acyltransferase family protein [Lewinellaceae bacterium SD302]|nr:membrane-bound O-acyltransferase family protein [Lewinellaceae bacterium SD302]
MSFNSLEYGVFFAIFFFLYWFVTNRNLKWQNILILVASYIFYGWWDWRFLLLIFTSSLVDFLVGRGMERTGDDRKRKWLLYVSLAVNLGILGFFKYFNFFLDSFKTVFGNLSPVAEWSTLDIILPVGISFYTLQTLSYTFDVYKRKMKGTDDVISFFAYVSFFPQLVAGPIERATSLLPQFQKKRVFTYEGAADGMRQVTWGLFKKMVVADNCGTYVWEYLPTYWDHSGSTLFVATILGTFQLYCDFSGYSDIAIGSARILGFNLMKNFDYPFFARNIAEFWQKWHISLITWFRDYLIGWLKGYTKLKLVRNIFIIFLITGLWHGAAWTYIVWGLMNAMLFLPIILGKRVRYRKPVAHGRALPTLREFWKMFRTVTIFGSVGVMFLSPTVYDGFAYFKNVFSLSLFTLPMPPTPRIYAFIILIVVEWRQRTREHGMDFTGQNIPAWQRWLAYLLVVLCILFYGGVNQEFIYFQF